MPLCYSYVIYLLFAFFFFGVFMCDQQWDIIAV